MTPSEHLRAKSRCFKRLKRAVVKIGSSIISGDAGIRRPRLRALVADLAALHKTGLDLVIVTSGAVAAGRTRLGLTERPKTIPQRQAAAAVGQIDLMALYEEYFSHGDIRVGQVLLTHDDLASRQRYMNAKQTIETLLQARVIPIANENDTVAVEELNFGDNDNLSALVAALVDADLLVILSDVSGLFTADPRRTPDAERVPLVRADTDLERVDVRRDGGQFGTGGMAAKVAAARKAAAAGIPTVIADGQHDGILPAVFDAQAEVGTLILPSEDRLTRRKHWIAYTLRPSGSLVVDAGAYAALRQRGRSLLPAGVRQVQGRFEAGACVRCLSPEGREFARGLVNYSAADIEKIKGLQTAQIESALGYKISDEVIHRDALAVVERGDQS